MRGCKEGVTSLTGELDRILLAVGGVRLDFAGIRYLLRIRIFGNAFGSKHYLYFIEKLFKYSCMNNSSNLNKIHLPSMCQQRNFITIQYF